MTLWSSLASRNLQPELMDQPELDEARHLAALEALRRINYVSRSAGILWPAIRAMARESKGRRLSVLDLACGGGDVPIRLWRNARREGIDLRVVGADVSDRAVEQSRRNAQRAAADVEFRVVDVLDNPAIEEFDVVCSSLFLHHLDENSAVRLLGTMKRVARRLVLVNDLVRSRAGFVLARLGTQVLSRSDVARVDGPRSVEGAFTIDEVRALATRAGLQGSHVVRRWPCRYLLSWRKP